MYQLEYYFSNVRAANYTLQPDEEIKTIGAGECHFPLRSDRSLQSVHFMIRFVEEHIELCPVGTVSLNNRVLKLNEWSPVPFNEKIILTKQSYIILKGGQNTPNLSVQYAEEEESTSLLEEQISANAEEVEQSSAQEEGFIQQSEISEDEEKHVERLVRRSEIAKEQGSALELPQDLIGKTVANRYQVVKKIGSGAMGDVYEVLDKELRRKLALKIMKYSGLESTAGKRFVREAQTLVKLRHPNIVQVHDAGKIGNCPFFAMDYLQGKTLKEVIDTGKTPPRQAMTWVKQIAQALDVVHKAGIIHRDIKPGNIMIVQNRAILMDFGIAKDTSQMTQLTTTGETLGTPAYMSPEQAVGNSKEISPVSDVYSLGAVLYEVLARRPPFTGATIQIIQQVCTEDPIPIHKIQPDVHPDAEIIALKAMTKESAYRYPNTIAMAEDIQRHLDGEAIQGTLAPFVVRWKRILRQNQKVVRVATLLLAIFLGILGWNVYQNWKLQKERSIQIKEYLETADTELAKLSSETNLSEMIRISEKYSQAISLGAKKPEIYQNKFKILLAMANFAHDKRIWNLSQALHYQAKQILTEFPDDTHSKLFQQIWESVIQKQNEDKQLQLQQAREILADLDTPDTQSTVKNVSLQLIQFSSVMSDIVQEYQNHKNSKIRDAVKQANQLYESNFIVQEPQSWDQQEKYMIALLPYSNNPTLPRSLLEGTQKDNVPLRVFCYKMLGLIHSKDPKISKLLSVQVQNEKNSEALKYAILSLLMLNDGDTLLISDISSGRTELRNLGYAGRWALPILEKLIPVLNTDSSTKMALAETFLQIGSESVPSLLKCYEKSTQESEKITIIEILEKFDSPKIAQFIFDIYNKSNESIQELSLRILVDKYFSESSARDIFLSSLNQENSKIRVLAIQGLAKIADEEILSKLIRELESSDIDIQNVTKKSLEIIPNNLTPRLVSEYHKANELIKPHLLKILAVRQSEAIVPILIQHLSNPKARYQDVKLAQEYLPKIGTSALNYLYQSYNNAKEVNIQLQIIEVIRQISDPNRLEFYQKALLKNKEEGKIFDALMQAMGECGLSALSKLTELLMNSSGNKAAKIAEACAKIGKDAIPTLIDKLKKCDTRNTEDFKNEHAARNLLFVLEKIGGDSLDSLTKQLRITKNYTLQMMLIESLARFSIYDKTNIENFHPEISDPKVIPVFLEIIFSENVPIQEAGKESLYKIGYRAMPFLMESFIKSNRKEEKRVFLFIIGEIQKKQAEAEKIAAKAATIIDLPKVEDVQKILNFLYPLLKDKDKDFVQESAEAIKQFNPEKVIFDLVPQLSDPLMQNGVELVIRKIGPKNAIEPLEKLLTNDKISGEIRKYAPHLISLLPTLPPHIPRLIFDRISSDVSQEVRTSSEQAFKKIAPKMLNVIVADFYSNPTFRLYREIIKENSDASAQLLLQDPFGKNLQRNIEDLRSLAVEMTPEAKNKIARGLSKIIDKQPINIKIMIIDTFGMLKATQMRDFLQRYTKDPNTEIKDVAIRTLQLLK